ncbi:hypothetical protein B6265_08155 [Salmonella enterica]|nr:hypothetical protein [Salmonella enterica]EBT1573086.1 hypothetical protein [Salmonella enterica]EHC5988910.1 hypothetical protein [Salmonella enterica]
MAIKKRSATVVPGASGAAATIKKTEASRNSFWGELPQHIMSGISRMVPTLIMGGVILAFSQLIAYSWLEIPADTGIPSYMVGAIVGSTFAVWLGAVQWFPESAIWAWPLVSHLGVYIAGILLGAVITALMVVFLRHMMYRRGKLLIESL